MSTRSASLTSEVTTSTQTSSVEAFDGWDSGRLFDVPAELAGKAIAVDSDSRDNIVAGLIDSNGDFVAFSGNGNGPIALDIPTPGHIRSIPRFTETITTPARARPSPSPCGRSTRCL